MAYALSANNDCKLLCNTSPYLVALEEMVIDLTKINENQNFTPLQKLTAFQGYLTQQKELLEFADKNYIKVAQEVADPETYGFPFLQESSGCSSFKGDYPLANFSKLEL